MEHRNPAITMAAGLMGVILGVSGAAGQQHAQPRLWPAPAGSFAVAGPLSDGSAPAAGAADDPAESRAAMPAAALRPRNYALMQAGALAGGGALTFAVLLALPAEISKWDRDAGFRGPQLANLRRAFTSPPVWDEDEWLVNLVGHPLVGMHTYLLDRNAGASPLRSFVLSTAASVGWEYLIESWAEQPSIQDLLFTSTIGSLLGEANFQLTQRLRRDGLRGWEKLAVTVLNPHDVLYRGYAGRR
jgi:hypothetical protein